MMDRVKMIKSMSIEMVNKTNGAYTSYLIYIVPDTEIQTDDVIRI